MNIKSLLLGSAAALIAVSGARAADAVTVAEPEPAEYVKICDVYGAGYFYIPGTETCLKINGYIRFQVNVGENEGGDSDWDAVTRGQVQFTAKSDTEYGPLTGVIVLQANADNATSAIRVASSARRGFACRSMDSANCFRRKRFSAASAARGRHIAATNRATSPITRRTI